MSRLRKIGLTMGMLLLAGKVFSAPWQGHVLADAGWYWGSFGEAQHIGISTLEGDNFSVANNHRDNNYILGVGYMVNSFQDCHVEVDAGIHAYYLDEAKVSGVVTQENLFTNLSYQYYIRNIPVYFAAKGLFTSLYQGLSFTLEGGIGPNWVSAKHFSEASLDGGITIPENIFSDEHRVVFSAMLGAGVRFIYQNKLPIELGYHFFYLGNVSLSPNNPAVLNSLRTGNNYAQALTLTFSA